MPPIAVSVLIAALASYQLLSSGTVSKITHVLNSVDLASRLSILVIVFSFIAITSSVFESLNEKATETVEVVSPAEVVLDVAEVMTEEPKVTEEPTSAPPDPIPSPVVSYPFEAMSHCKDDKEKFLAIYPMLRDEMLAHMEANEMLQEARDWCKEMMDYNVPGGKLNRGLTVVAVQKTLIQAKYGRDLTDLEFARASVLGWALEFLQAFFLVADDIMDDSKTRRGQPCWYKLPKVANIAINDSFLLESYVFTMIRMHFGTDSFYHNLVELYLQVIQQTEFGQLLDLTSQPHGSKKIQLDRFTLERYKLIVKYKTAFYTFYLPVAIGMITSGTTDKESLDFAQSICCIMGEYFQIQDDVLDCYGEPAMIGKIGTDIQDSKCSWLVVQALSRVNAGQRKVLEENYGQWDDRKVNKVKALYKDLKLKELFEQYEEESYQNIQKALDQSMVPREVFDVLLRKIYKRSY